MDNAQFRLDFPEFSDVVRYPDSMLDFWSGIGENLISESRWGNVYTQGIKLFTAHNIVLAAEDERASASGAIPGGQGGAVASKAVGSVSKSYDNSNSVELNAGHWNQTRYGRQYIRLARLIGSGCVQL